MNAMPSNYAAILSEICKEEGITLTPLSDYWAFHLSKESVSIVIYGYQFPLNSASSASVCTDKSTAGELLSLFHIPCVPHTCFMNPEPMKYASPQGSYPGIQKLLDQYREIVLKDNTGTGGDLVFRAKTLLQAENAAEKIFAKSPSMAVCPFETIEEEYRVILLGQDMKLIYQKLRPSLTGDGSSCLKDLYARYLLEHRADQIQSVLLFDRPFSYVPAAGETVPLNWKHNLGQGATAAVLYPFDEIAAQNNRGTEASPQKSTASLITELSGLAKKAAQVLGITFASIDIIHTAQGLKILEVNSGVMMEYLSLENQAHKQLAKEIYREAILASLR